MNDLIPWLDLSRQYRKLQPLLLPVLDTLLARGSGMLAPAVERFEAEFARFVGARHCVGVTSGSVALQLALRSLGVGPSNDVITAPAAPMASINAIRAVGARPVFVDIEPHTYCMDPAELEEAITPKTRALMPVHLYGHVADMPAIGAIARRHGLAIVEDASSAHGAALHGKHAGTFGQTGCFSFYPGKNLGGYGEAGAVVTDDPALAERIRHLRDRGTPPLRMEGFHGTLLSVKLPQLPAWTAGRRRIAEKYASALAGLEHVQLPMERPGVRHNWHIYGVGVQDREMFRAFLASRGVQTSVHYRLPIHLQPAYWRLGYQPGDFPVAESLCATQVTLPMFAELTDAEVERVIDAVVAWNNRQAERALPTALLRAG